MIRAIFLASVLAFSTAQPAAAQSAPRTHSVSLLNLNLASQAGQAALDRQLERAAFAVCGAMIVGDKVGNAHIAGCRTETLAQARREAAVIMASRPQKSKLAVRGR